MPRSIQPSSQRPTQPSLPGYAELHCVTNFSFLRGASHAQELVERASALGYSALAITDECSLAGVVRAYQAHRALPKAEREALKLIIGAEFRLPTPSPVSPHRPLRPHRHGPRLLLLAVNRDGYGNLSELISTARRRAPKGRYELLSTDLDAGVPDCLALLVPDPQATVEAISAQARWLGARFPGRCWIVTELLMHGGDEALLEKLRLVADFSGQPLVAAGDVEFHLRSRKSLQDLLTAIRLQTTVAGLGSSAAANAEQHLRSRLRLARLYPQDLLAATLAVASRCSFSLSELRYEYPEELVPEGETPTTWLATLTERGLARRYPQGVPATVRALVDRELALIAELHYEPYFLTVADIVTFARGEKILCQGRGSAANSVVCYALHITEVDPARIHVLFERFISKERGEPPDIDVDFEHDRREEVIQYIYKRYGRDRAALTATVISYRPRSTLRDVGKALGVDPQRIDRLTKSMQWWDDPAQADQTLSAQGFDPDTLVVQQWIAFTQVLLSFPRHLSQHTGGFVIARDRLTRLVPIENASMKDRSVIEWDKDDLDALGLLKVDVLALGMLSAIRRALEMIGRRRGLPGPLRMQDIPDGDAATYRMIQKADTIGVFQVESRAQMSMLPRLKPASYYDLVIQVAIVRPGPIQGGMVHPYLRRRHGLDPEPEECRRPELRPALERTLGIPIFQEQVMQIAMIAADFTAGEADKLRRAMAAWKRKGGLDSFHPRLLAGMLRNGYSEDFAERIFQMMRGFGDYGFPESHAASFAHLVYVSSWIKHHEPAAFLAALLNSQPMGFYAPAQLVRDARAHGVEVRAVDVLKSEWDCTLEEQDDPDLQPAVRLGFNRIKGMRETEAHQIVAARECQIAGSAVTQRVAAPFCSVEDLAHRADLDQGTLKRLAGAGALEALAGNRRQALWTAAGLPRLNGLLSEARFDEAQLQLRPPTEAESITADYASVGLSMGRHPLALLRPHLATLRIFPAVQLHTLRNGQLARACGIVTHRQRPQTAKGTVFITIEDETGAVNIIVHQRVFNRYRKVALEARLMLVYGVWQRDELMSGEVEHLVARRFEDGSGWIGEMAVVSRDFH